ncbi:MAG: hypothetical protein OSJ65_04175 [Bacilli bacterium]|nr:hypothetical protein [Bacilli bacterium]
MNKAKESVLRKSESYLEKYKDDNSIYYKELKKSFKEYKNIELKDKVTNDLYIKHLNELCEFIKSKKNANKIIFALITSCVFIIIISCFTTYKYYELAHNIENNVLFKNGSTYLTVNYGNFDNFDANTLSDVSSYKNLEPLTLTILASNRENKQKRFHYDVYLIEENQGLQSESVLSKDALLYNVNTTKKESGIKSLKNATVNKNRLLIYSGEMLTNQEEEIDLRLWIDSNTDLDYMSKKFKFKLFVEGYVI